MQSDAQPQEESVTQRLQEELYGSLNVLGELVANLNDILRPFLVAERTGENGTTQAQSSEPQIELSPANQGVVAATLHARAIKRNLSNIISRIQA